MQTLKVKRFAEIIVTLWQGRVKTMSCPLGAAEDVCLAVFRVSYAGSLRASVSIEEVSLPGTSEGGLLVAEELLESVANGGAQ